MREGGREKEREGEKYRESEGDRWEKGRESVREKRETYISGICC